ncbi:M20/M25/M40 family metallo-hydrolase [Candidatus Poribacteria bacterium]|jgi:hypothetical protein|nr:M20/M25/M40 family metallo-hydrolase [Candidatus Poribacteria bacterium]MBT7805955.1 M20/M25/M40 family metallo-hydrolase [Candidatus Poribacteria bacterium]
MPPISQIARWTLMVAIAAVVAGRALAESDRVFLRVPYRSPEDLIAHTRDGGRVRHLSDAWAIVEVDRVSPQAYPSMLIGEVREGYEYAWTVGAAPSVTGVDTLFVWGDYALVGAPRGEAERLHHAALPHRVAPLGVIADDALRPFAAPDIRVSAGQRDAVADRVLRAFDSARWEHSVRTLADNGGTHSRYAWRVRDAMLLNGHPPPDHAADDAGDWIAEQLRSYGYVPEEHTFPYSAFVGSTRAATFHMRNIIAERAGVGQERDEVILVTAHYDTKASRTEGWETRWRDMPAPGADDNATGVATVLEIARLLADIPLGRTVRFALFSGEELGLIGSRHYAHATRDAGDDIAAVINIDMIGHDADGRFDLHVVANRRSRWLLEAVESLRRVIDSPIALLPEVNSDFTFSDHAPFWWEGYSALFVAEETDFRSGEFPAFYHTSDDTPDKVNFAYGAEAARLIAGIVAMLAAPDAAPGPSALPAREQVSVLGAVAFPNPYVIESGVPLRIEYRLADAVDVRAEVYTAAGKRVFGVATFPAPSEAGVVLWDGATEEGEPAPPGLYFVRIEARDRMGTPHLRTLRVFVSP